MAYGKMLRPLKFECKEFAVNWLHYNCGKTAPDYQDKDKIVIDSILHLAWQFHDECIGLFFENVSDYEQMIKINLQNMKPLLQHEIKDIFLYSNGNKIALDLNGKVNKELMIPAKSVVM